MFQFARGNAKLAETDDAKCITITHIFNDVQDLDHTVTIGAVTIIQEWTMKQNDCVHPLQL